uniref:Uncharacterized protein n=1 Tax=Bombyx mori TaxID=7091 RepID=A0A8R2HQ78_BOMMO|nr:uncharacterized protein LOC110385259 [Bombyx mori]
MFEWSQSSVRMVVSTTRRQDGGTYPRGLTRGPTTSETMPGRKRQQTGLSRTLVSLEKKREKSKTEASVTEMIQKAANEVQLTSVINHNNITRITFNFNCYFTFFVAVNRRLFV